MTRDEAVRTLQSMKSDFPLPKAAQTRRAQNDALDVAIEVLKAESCDDAISRQAAIDALKEHRGLYCDDSPNTFSKLPCSEKCRVDELDTAIATLVNLPSVQPEVKKISYIDCTNAMLMMWMDEVLTDGEYNRIMDKLNEHEKKKMVKTMDDSISRQAAVDEIEFGITYEKAINKETGEVKELFQEGNEELKKAAERVKALPPAQLTIYGYNVEHLELIARILQKENMPPEKVVELLTDIGRIGAIISDEFEETLRKAVEQCTI